MYLLLKLLHVLAAVGLVTGLVPRRRRREIALRDAVSAGRITPELRSALDDRSVPMALKT